MRLGIISDSHGVESVIKEGILQMGKIDLVFFAGDGIKDAEKVSKELGIEMIAVSGNCDYSSVEPTEKILETGSKRILLTHGHRYDVKHRLSKLYYRAKEIEADIVIFGHTHEPQNFVERGVLFFNPGSITIPRGRNPRTFGIINIEEDGRVWSEIFNLDKCMVNTR